MSVANQKRVVVRKVPRGERHTFLQIGEQENRYAWAHLSPAAKMVWEYFIKNADGFELDASPQAIENYYGHDQNGKCVLSRSRASSVLNHELIEQGFYVDGVMYEHPPRMDQELAAMRQQVSELPIKESDF